LYKSCTSGPDGPVPPVSAVVLCVQLLEEPASYGPDPNVVDVTHLKAVRGGPERLVVDEDAVDDCPDRLRSVPVDERRDRRIEMRILVLGSRVLRSVDYEADRIVDRCVFGISGLLTNVIMGLWSAGRTWPVRVSCDTVASADVNGAENTRQKVLPSLAADSSDRDDGWLAQPAVHLFDQSEGGFAPREEVVNRES
jgi:hypothetical protein